MRKLIGLFAVVSMLPAAAFAQGHHGDHHDSRSQHGNGRAAERAPAHNSDRGKHRGWEHESRHQYPQGYHDRSDRVRARANYEARYHGHFNDHVYRVPQGWGHRSFSRDYIGPRHVWRIEGGRRDRFRVRGAYFQVATYDYRYADRWYFDRDNVVIYDDPDNAGYYLAFNVRLGSYLHVVYMGD
jgi:hypothetical protein